MNKNKTQDVLARQSICRYAQKYEIAAENNFTDVFSAHSYKCKDYKITVKLKRRSSVALKPEN